MVKVLCDLCENHPELKKMKTEEKEGEWYVCPNGHGTLILVKKDK